MFAKMKKTVSFILLLTFGLVSICPSDVFAQAISSPSGTTLNLSAQSSPIIIKGLKIDPNNSFNLNFILNIGDADLKEKDVRAQAEPLIKYFMTALTVPEDQMWVNLSPFEKDRLVPEALGKTDMGRDLLAQDYLLKQLTASLMSPENENGKKFWDKVYQKISESKNVSSELIESFNKVWIIPDRAVVYENDNTGYVVEQRLKVMLESDYLARQSSGSRIEKLNGGESMADDIKNIIREAILPIIEDEVNYGEAFASLRQIYSSMILATWYKQNLRKTILGRVYVNQSKTSGIETNDTSAKERIYHQYLEAFQKGAYNVIKEDYDPSTQEIKLKQYFTGGYDAASLVSKIETQNGTDLALLNEALRGNNFDLNVNLRKIFADSAQMNRREFLQRLSVLAVLLSFLPEELRALFLSPKPISTLPEEYPVKHFLMRFTKTSIMNLVPERFRKDFQSLIQGFSDEKINSLGKNIFQNGLFETLKDMKFSDEEKIWKALNLSNKVFEQRFPQTLQTRSIADIPLDIPREALKDLESINKYFIDILLPAFQSAIDNYPTDEEEQIVLFNMISILMESPGLRLLSNANYIEMFSQRSSPLYQMAVKIQTLTIRGYSSANSKVYWAAVFSMIRMINILNPIFLGWERRLSQDMRLINEPNFIRSLKKVFSEFDHAAEISKRRFMFLILALPNLSNYADGDFVKEIIKNELNKVLVYAFGLIDGSDPWAFHDIKNFYKRNTQLIDVPLDLLLFAKNKDFSFKNDFYKEEKFIISQIVDDLVFTPENKLRIKEKLNMVDVYQIKLLEEFDFLMMSLNAKDIPLSYERDFTAAEYKWTYDFLTAIQNMRFGKNKMKLYRGCVGINSNVMQGYATITNAAIILPTTPFILPAGVLAHEATHLYQEVFLYKAKLEASYEIVRRRGLYTRHFEDGWWEGHGEVAGDLIHGLAYVMNKTRLVTKKDQTDFIQFLNLCALQYLLVDDQDKPILKPDPNDQNKEKYWIRLLNVKIETGSRGESYNVNHYEDIPVDLDSKGFIIKIYHSVLNKLPTIQELSENDGYKLEPNYPNAFSGTTTIEFNLPRAMRAEIKIFDMTGRAIQTLGHNGQAGINKVTWDARHVPDGTYIYYLSVDGKYSDPEKMVVTNRAMLKEENQNKDMAPGGVDLNSAHLNLQVKDSGKGIEMNLDQALDGEENILGFTPVIVSVQPFVLPIAATLKN